MRNKMKLSEAKNLLISLKREVKQPLGNQTYRDEISKKFVQTILTGKVVASSSVRGWLASKILPDTDLFAQKSTIEAAFVTAIKTVWADQNANVIFKDQFFSKLRQEFKEAKLLREFVPPEFSPEFETLDQIRNHKLGAQEEAIRSNSLIHQSIPPIFNLAKDSSIFTTLFGSTESAFEKSKGFFFKFLRLRSDLGLQQTDFQKRLDLINTAAANDASVQKFPADQKERGAKIKNKAKALSCLAQSMKVGQRWMCAGSFGAYVNNVTALMRHTQRLHGKVFNNFPPFARNIVTSEEFLHNPKEYADQAVQPYLDSIFNKFPDIKSKVSKGPGKIILDLLLYDSNKKLPGEERLAFLPKVIREELNALFQNGLAGCLVDGLDGRAKEVLEWVIDHSHDIQDVMKKHKFVQEAQNEIKKYAAAMGGRRPDIANNAVDTLQDQNKKLLEKGLALLPKKMCDELNKLFDNRLVERLVGSQDEQSKKVLKWIIDNSKDIQDTNEVEEFAQEMEETIRKYPADRISEGLELAGKGAENLVGQALELIPANLLTLSGLDAHLAHGQVWLELERRNNGTFDVYVYATGQALKYFEQNGSGQHHWPLKIEGVPYSKLDAEFFYSFLFHQLEPNYNANVSSTAEDFFDGLFFGYLKPDHKPHNAAQDTQKRYVKQHIHSREEMVRQMVINPDHSLKRVEFEFQLHALTEYCQTCMRDNQLVIDNDKVESELALGHEYVNAAFLELKSELDQSYLVKIEATLQEINNALLTYKQTNAGKNPIVTQLKGTLPSHLFSQMNDVGMAVGPYLDKVKTTILNSGITAEHWLALKENLGTLLGPQIKPLLNFVSTLFPHNGEVQSTANTSATEIEESTALLTKKDNKWEQKSLLIRFLSHAYTQIAYKTIKVMLTLYCLSNPFLSKFVLLFGIEYVLNNLIPPEYLTWYHAVMARVRNAILQGTLNIIMSFSLSKKLVGQLQAQLKKNLDPLERVGNILNNKDPLSYEIKNVPKDREASFSLGADSNDQLDGVEQVFMDLKTSDHKLHALKRFCDISQITAWKNPNENHIGGFKLNPFNLQFQVKQDEAGQQAHCQGNYPGYFLAKDQWDPSVRGISSYLILESQNEPKKVLIRDGQWITSAAWRGLQNFGPLAHLASEYLTPLNKTIWQTASSFLNLDLNKYYEYHIDDQGQLVSEDPEAVAYLTILQLAQGKREAAFKTCRQFEKLAKRTTFSSSVFKILMPLSLIAFELEDFRTIRMRLFAALEENQLTHKASAKVDEQKIATELVQGLSALLDLNYILANPDPKRNLSLSQEWFLYHKAIRALRLLAEKGTNPISKKIDETWWLSNLTFMDTESVIEIIGLKPNLSKRYRELQKQLGISNDTLWKKGAQAIKDVFAADSTAPEGIFLHKMADRHIKTQNNELDINNSRGQKFLKLGRYLAQRGIDIKLLDIKKLRSEINIEQFDNNPPFSVMEMTPELFKKNFINYYRIAKGDNLGDNLPKQNKLNTALSYVTGFFSPPSEQKVRLKEMLALLKGGWDPQTQSLIFYLEAILEYPILFPTTKELKSKVDSPQDWNSFWKKITACVALVQSIKLGAPMLEKTALTYGIPSKLYRAVTVSVNLLQMLPFQGMVDHALDLVGRGIKSCFSSATPSQATKIEATTPDYTLIQNEDAIVDAHLDNIFTMIFQPDRLHTKGEKELWAGYITLETLSETYKQSIEQTKNTLLNHFNSQKKDGTIVTIEQLEMALFKNDFTQLIISHQISQEEVTHITKILVLCMAKETRLLQMQRALTIMEGLIQTPSDAHDANFDDNLKLLVETLEAKRSYINLDSPIRFKLLMIYLLIEKKTNKMVGPRQAEYIERLLSANMDNAAELLISLGTTATITPALSTIQASDQKPVFVLQTNIKNASNQAQHVFDQMIHGLMFSREIPLSIHELDALAVIFRSSLNGDVCSMTKEDAQTLELIMLDRIHNYRNLSLREQVQENSSIDAFRRLLKIMRESKGMSENAHDVFDSHQELSFPVGPKAMISKSIYRVIEKAMKCVMNEPSLQDSVDNIAPRIAQQMLNHSTFKLQRWTVEEQQAFVNYVTGNLIDIPAHIRNNYQVFEETAMLKGFLTVLLGKALESLSSESNARRPYETLVNKFVTLAHKGLDEEQTKMVIAELKKKADEQAKIYKTSIQKTKIYKKHSDEGSAFNPFTMTATSEQLQAYGKKADIIKLYVRYFVHKEITYSHRSFCSNSQNFATQFDTLVSDTVTDQSPEDRYKSQLHKIHNVVRRAVLDKILYCPSVDYAMEIFKGLESVFTSPIEDDPTKLFALDQEKILYKQGLDDASAEAFKPIASGHYFNPQELAEIRAELERLANPPEDSMPSHVPKVIR